MNINKKRTLSKKNIFLIILFSSFIALFFTSLLGNIFSLAIEKEYFIPKQSSIFTFNETVHNNGSSDVWRYGEDYTNYYFNLSDTNNSVLVFPKADIDNCAGFDPENVTTWCGLKAPKIDF
jgi:hypothetical protein